VERKRNGAEGEGEREREIKREREDITISSPFSGTGSFLSSLLSSPCPRDSIAELIEDVIAEHSLAKMSKKGNKFILFFIHGFIV